MERDPTEGLQFGEGGLEWRQLLVTQGLVRNDKHPQTGGRLGGGVTAVGRLCQNNLVEMSWDRHLASSYHLQAGTVTGKTFQQRTPCG